MSAIVCGKRSFFEELSTSPASASPPVAKKLRCSSTSPVRLPVFHNSSHVSALTDQLQALFPNMDKQMCLYFWIFLGWLLVDLVYLSNAYKLFVSSVLLIVCVNLLVLRVLDYLFDKRPVVDFFCSL
ncbi:hypothetical protein Hdeb2414_s0016g00485491 [Helianthus debilis subsp. tardiflorus]